MCVSSTKTNVLKKSHKHHANMDNSGDYRIMAS